MRADLKKKKKKKHKTWKILNPKHYLFTAMISFAWICTADFLANTECKPAKLTRTMRRVGNLGNTSHFFTWKYFKCSHCSRSFRDQTTCTISTLILPRTSRRMQTGSDVTQQGRCQFCIDLHNSTFLVVQRCKTDREPQYNMKHAVKSWIGHRDGRIFQLSHARRST